MKQWQELNLLDAVGKVPHVKTSFVFKIHQSLQPFEWGDSFCACITATVILPDLKGTPASRCAGLCWNNNNNNNNQNN